MAKDPNSLVRFGDLLDAVNKATDRRLQAIPSIVTSALSSGDLVTLILGSGETVAEVSPAPLKVFGSGATAIVLRDTTDDIEISIKAGAAAAAIGTNTSHAFNLRTSNVDRWRVESAGHLSPAADNIYDLGSASTKLKIGYFGTAVYVGAQTDTVGATSSTLRVQNPNVASATFRDPTADIECEFGVASGFPAGFIQTVTNHDLLFRTNAITRWTINTSGHLFPSGNYDIGGSSVPVHDIYFSDFLEGAEIIDPAAPAANKGRLYFKDNGSGKTQLVVVFNTGAVQVIATQP